ncbi:hypothetical protein C2W62_25355 [Candidatus Entotheonella serta]|nr:hypothetical protein C2W62_25355 [Candidatus Entotheonella serta]
MQWPQKILTDGGKYTIEIRQSLSQTDHGVVTVKVAEPYRTALEGTTVKVIDGAGRFLFRGQIIDGEVAQIIDGLSSLQLRFVVQPG